MYFMNPESVAVMKLLVWILTCSSCVSVVVSFLLADQCPDCHWNGRCNTHTGKCHCYDGFTGVDCTTDCGCQGHGHCKPDNTCDCEKGWKWSSSTKQCVMDCNCPAGVACIAPGVCGCSHTCEYGTCWNGQCECWAGYRGSNCSLYDPVILKNRNISVGLNLAGLSYWSSELKFVDVAKQSQEWITERTTGPHSHQWDTHEHDNITWRNDGYPAVLPPHLVVGKLVLRSSAGVHGPKGNFTVLYDGEGELDFGLVKHHIYYHGKGRMIVNFNENSGGIFIKIMKTNLHNPVHNIRVIIPGFEARHERFPYYPAFLETLVRYSEFRFMDFFHTNAHTPEPTTWSTRRLPDFHTQASSKGASIEYAIQLSNMMGANPWFNQPHAADDDFVTKFATLVKNTLRPDLKVYLEYSNEVWNGIFRQTRYSQEQGTKMGLDSHSFRAGMKFYNIRSVQVMQIWKKVFGNQSHRLIPVWAWQTGYHDYTRQALEDLGAHASNFKALGITSYFSCGKATHLPGFKNLTFAEVAQLCKNDTTKLANDFNYYMDKAKKYNLTLLSYEAGPGLESSRINDDDVTRHAIEFNAHGLMEDALTAVLETWYNIVNTDPYNTFPGGLFNYFSSTGSPSKYGSWGMLEYTGQDPRTVPKYRAVQRYIVKNFINNTHVWPTCSFVVNHHVTYGCFIPGSYKYRCGHSVKQSNGTSWMFYPDISGTGNILEVDGFNPQTHSLFVRSVDTLAANTYYTINTWGNHTWITHTMTDYHRMLASPDVTRSLPYGVVNQVKLGHSNKIVCF